MTTQKINHVIEHRTQSMNSKKVSATQVASKLTGTSQAASGRKTAVTTTEAAAAASATVDKVSISSHAAQLQRNKAASAKTSVMRKDTATAAFRKLSAQLAMQGVDSGISVYA